MIEAPARLEQRLVRGVAYERVLEHVQGPGRALLLVQDLGVDELLECALERLLVDDVERPGEVGDQLV